MRTTLTIVATLTVLITPARGFGQARRGDPTKPATDAELVAEAATVAPANSAFVIFICQLP